MDTQQTQQMAAGLVGIFVLVGLIFLAFFLFLLWRIFNKAGLSPWLSLLVLVPFGPIVVLCVLAFADWKVMPAPVAQLYPPNYPPPPPPAYPPAAPPTQY